MKKTSEYDERQIAEQMKAYRCGFIVSMVLISLMHLLTDSFEMQIDVEAAIRICFWIPITVVGILVIINDAYMIKGWQIFMLHLLGIWGVLSAVGCIYILCHSGEVQEGISLTVTGLCWAVADVVYIIKRRQNEKFRDEFAEPEN